MMFNREDRALLIRVEAKADMALNRIGLLEGRQATHEAICDQREKAALEYRANVKENEQESRIEWKKFKDSTEAATTQLLWKIIVAMFAVIGGAAGIILALFEHGALPVK